MAWAFHTSRNTVMFAREIGREPSRRQAEKLSMMTATNMLVRM